MDTDRSARLVSLDLFRGSTIAAMILVNNPGSWSHVYGPLRHAEWHGLNFPDVIFPFFLFIVGVAAAYSLGRRRESGKSRRSIYEKVFRRALILFALGLFLNAFPSFEWSTMRIPGVLQRIAVCYLVTAVIVLHSTWKAHCAWAIGLLLAHWAAMEWVPVPGIGAGVYERGANLAAYVDGLVLKGHMWQATKTWDPEGLISTIPAVSTTLFGVLAGQWLRSGRMPHAKAVRLLVTGGVGVCVGASWHIMLPINKSLWTGSYAVVTAGLAAVCLGVCYLTVDVRGSRGWIQPGLVYGMNAIAVYVLAGVTARLLYSIPVPAADGTAVPVKAWIYDNLLASWMSATQASLVYSVLFVLVMYCCMLIPYRKRIYITV